MERFEHFFPAHIKSTEVDLCNFAANFCSAGHFCLWADSWHAERETASRGDRTSAGCGRWTWAAHCERTSPWSCPVCSARHVAISNRLGTVPLVSCHRPWGCRPVCKDQYQGGWPWSSIAWETFGSLAFGQASFSHFARVVRFNAWCACGSVQKPRGPSKPPAQIGLAKFPERRNF